MAELTVSTHPLLLDKLTRLRDETTDTATFRRVLRECGAILTIEATRGLRTAIRAVKTPLATTDAPVLARSIAFVSVLRAGEGLLAGALDVAPGAVVGHVGFQRDETTLEAKIYVERLPIDLSTRTTLLLAPMHATGGTSSPALDRLRAAGAQDVVLVCLVAAPEGVERVRNDHPEVPIVIGALDERLNDVGYIVPGLGDAGDRLFGT
jgi:uracil phosphoribosyltransferase